MTVTHESERSAFKKAVHALAVSYDEAVRYAEEVQPYWLSLRQPWNGQLQWTLFDYFPATHYHKALHGLKTDGGFDDLHRGEQRAPVYYWLHPQTGATLYHTSAYDDEANPFFGTVEEAEAFSTSRPTRWMIRSGTQR